MPFTPYHLGPALGLGLLLRKYLHAPTFMLANVIVDVEPFLVLVFGLRYPLHGYLHTFFAAFFLGLAVGYAGFLLESFLHPIFKVFLLEVGDRLNLRSFLFAGVLGTLLHVLLDSPLYDDIRPFYPLTANPLYNPALSSEVYGVCVWMGIFGMIFYACLLSLSACKKALCGRQSTEGGLFIFFLVSCINHIYRRRSTCSMFSAEFYRTCCGIMFCYG
jgi:hypothetical protein